MTTEAQNQTEIVNLNQSPEAALDNLESKVDQNLEQTEKKSSQNYEKALSRLNKCVNNPDRGYRANLRAVSRVLSARSASLEDKSLAMKILNGIDKDDVDKWVKKNPDMAGPILTAWLAAEADNLGKKKFESLEKSLKGNLTLSELAGDAENLPALRALPAKDLLNPKFSTPEGLRALFLDGGVVDFHGNPSARSRIGAGDFYSPSQKFVRINGVVGQRSLDAKFNKHKIGYVSQSGDYLAVTGGEKLDLNFISDDTQGFESSLIGESFEHKSIDGTILLGEEAYNAEFLSEVEADSELGFDRADDEIDDHEGNLRGEALWNSPLFSSKMKKLCSALGIEQSWMKSTMKMESGLNPKAVNKTGGATGLIQFMPRTARGLGTSTQALREMSGVKQLDYVYEYYKNYAGKMTSEADLHLVAFYPLAMRKGPDFIIGSEKSMDYARLVARQNKSIPRDDKHTDVITKRSYYEKYESRS